MRRRLVRGLAAVLAGVVVLTGCSGPSSGGAAATVNGVDIGRDQVERNVRDLSSVRGRDPESLTPAERARDVGDLQVRVLSLLVQAQLITAMAQEHGVEVDVAAITAAVDEVISQSGEESFVETLGREQLTIELYRDVLRPAQAYVDGLRAQIQDGLGPEPVRAVRHVLVDTEAEADEIVDLLAGGADFGDLAFERSTDTGTADAGGDLGEAPRGVYVPTFEAAVWSAAVGEVVGPVPSDFGFHVLEVTAEATRDVADLPDIHRLQIVDSVLSMLIDEMHENAEVTVATGLGRWDPIAGEVVAAASGSSAGR